jgi:hypothetical protein
MRTKFWFDSLQGKDHSEYLHVDRKIALKSILGNYILCVWIGFMWLGIGTGGRLFVNTVINLRVSYKTADQL